MAIIPKPRFPNVPKLPGVPQLLRSPLFPASPSPVLGAAIALGRLWQSLFTQPLWAIYKKAEVAEIDDDGIEGVTVTAERQPVIVPDSFLEFGYRNEFTISDYPIQDGGFVSYDKVSNPFETNVKMSKGGSQQERKKFLDSIENIIGTMDLYDILTPEKTYLSVNVTRYEIIRQGTVGAFFFADVALYFREIRFVTSTYSNTSATTQNAQDPSAAPVTNTGTVQSQPTVATPTSLGIQSGTP